MSSAGLSFRFISLFPCFIVLFFVGSSYNFSSRFVSGDGAPFFFFLFFTSLSGGWRDNLLNKNFVLFGALKLLERQRGKGVKECIFKLFSLEVIILITLFLLLLLSHRKIMRMPSSHIKQCNLR